MVKISKDVAIMNAFQWLHRKPYEAAGTQYVLSFVLCCFSETDAWYIENMLIFFGVKLH